jgi:hypothetical protein
VNPDAELFYCPYCADQNLYPADKGDAWRCAGCHSIFAVTLVAIEHLHTRNGPAPQSAPGPVRSATTVARRVTKGTR